MMVSYADYVLRIGVYFKDPNQVESYVPNQAESYISNLHLNVEKKIVCGFVMP